MRLSLRLTVVSLIPVITSTALLAQEATSSPPEGTSNAREGIYASLGVSLATESDACSGSDCSGFLASPSSGWAGYFGAGAAIAPRWRVGVEFDGWTQTSSYESQSLVFYDAMATYYPSLTDGFWIKGGLGYARRAYQSGAVDGNIGNGISSGFAGGVGLGYDALVNPGGFSIIPYAIYLTQFGGSPLGNGSGALITGSLLQIGVGIGYRH